MPDPFRSSDGQLARLWPWLSTFCGGHASITGIISMIHNGLGLCVAFAAYSCQRGSATVETGDVTRASIPGYRRVWLPSKATRRP